MQTLCPTKLSYSAFTNNSVFKWEEERCFFFQDINSSKISTPFQDANGLDKRHLRGLSNLSSHSNSSNRYWPFIDHKKTHLQFDELKKYYGDVSSLSVTGTLYINLGTLKAVREAHVAKLDCFTKRVEVFSIMSEMFKDGVAFLNNEDWKVNRKFFLQILKERVSLSVKNLLSGSLYDAVNATIVELRAKQGEEVNIIEFLTKKCNANMRLVFFGENGISEENVAVINENYAVMMVCFTAPNLLLTGNIAKYLILPFTPGYKESMARLKKIEKILYQIIDEHKSTYDENHSRDIIDDYIKERIARRSKGDPTAQYFTDKYLMSSLVQILGDGVLSVAAFIALFLKTLLDHPEEQEKLYKELVEVVGHDRLPTIEDKSRLTYTNAFMLEGMRVADFFPFFPSMECTKETTISGYRIPKGSVSLMNIYSAHHDPETYEEPYKFNPSRFIKTDDKKKADPLVTFGVGKRACIGESFTMLQVFLFTTALVKNFKISVPEDIQQNTFELLMEGKLKIKLEPRN
ncbi:hypothetical protein JTE90_015421 [Oedothorax gibbosus]|uniref:Cytochrome P450 n=1 Tax=Oedothorax gibbosus TaxID=931172 RepID=A0AAV6TY13_9ARAC|nr:hypothetical protein JTE90_015421 [Oedothorax gibbosus]